MAITVRGLTINDKFQGVLMMAFDVDSKLIGTWSPINDTVKTGVCGNGKESITHTNKSDKDSISAMWHSPNITAGVVLIKATVAETYEIFYVGCFNATISPKTINNETTGTGSTASRTSPNTPVTTVSPSSDVGISLTWNYLNGMTNVRMVVNNLKIRQWVAFGLSTDTQMVNTIHYSSSISLPSVVLSKGDDHVFTCQHLADNSAVVQRLTNPGGHMRPIAATPGSGGTFTPKVSKVEDGSVVCEFTLSNFDVVKTRSIRQTKISSLSQTEQYRLLIAIGLLDSSNILQRHSVRRAEDKQVALNRQEQIIYNVNTQSDDGFREKLMKAHGCIMIFTWILIVSTGFLIARYFKKTWMNRKLCGEAVWFSIHRALMSGASLLTIVAFIFILVHQQGSWTKKTATTEYAHSIIGILVVSFAIIQPFMALFRCHHDDRYRFIYNYLHAFVGISAFFLSISAIFLAVFFSRFNLKANGSWGIMIVWTCWVTFILVAFECIEYYFKKNGGDKRSKKHETFQLDGTTHADKTATTSGRINVDSNPSKNKLKVLLLILHVVIAFALSLALVIIISAQ
ncbi:unnamed protein product [Didymodactylos carnosus]|uniref:Ferric-chelate reductase 1 n=1 Tax=Didymodactylos carnosus TaxID=1234261 RepID=A0A8S2J1Z2_9BILA|nr:unnamed protein product [Didymodactylos carnosus]CAF3783085.1 unnamed protein product [Didymodactylos carnosus]